MGALAQSNSKAKSKHQTCPNDDSIGDADADTCTGLYDANPDGCGDYDTDDFVAADLCCACMGNEPDYTYDYVYPDYGNMTIGGNYTDSPYLEDYELNGYDDYYYSYSEPLSYSGTDHPNYPT